MHRGIRRDKNDLSGRKIGDGYAGSFDNRVRGIADNADDATRTDCGLGGNEKGGTWQESCAQEAS